MVAWFYGLPVMYSNMLSTMKRLKNPSMNMLNCIPGMLSVDTSVLMAPMGNTNMLRNTMSQMIGTTVVRSIPLPVSFPTARARSVTPAAPAKARLSGLASVDIICPMKFEYSGLVILVWLALIPVVSSAPCADACFV